MQMPNAITTLTDAATAGPGLSFVRHGATAPNLAGQRCGGDVDVPLAPPGRAQAQAAALQIKAQGLHFRRVVHSGLLRTQETAQIIANSLGGVRLLLVPAFVERHLGQWNGTPIALHEAALAAGHTPPGGEANAVFVQRIREGVQQLLPFLAEGVLLVGSQGVARVLGEFSGQRERLRVGNGQVMHYGLAAMQPQREGAELGSAA
jgi:2,3-bisphosphoglycerate-dependent phosphoglycerate mutase